MTLAVDVRKALSPRFTLNVGFTAEPGITILFGASGSGKTTVLRAVSGLTRPDAGRIAAGERVFFNSASGVDVPVRERHVGYVFQHLALFPHMSIAGNIAYGLDRLPAVERQRRIATIADSFHISGVLDRRATEVSGGERQRAALARALVTDPSVLLLDEPLSALDHAIQSRIMDDLRQWNAAHRIPILYVTHAHREVFELGARVVVLDQGRVVATGSPHEVLDHPSHGGLATIAGFENVFEAAVTERHERAGTMRIALHGSRTELEVPLGHVPLNGDIRVAIRAGDILVANQPPLGLSARNVLPGKVLALLTQGPTVVAHVDAGARFVVHLTPGGVESLGLRPGDPAWLVIKTYSCKVQL